MQTTVVGPLPRRALQRNPTAVLNAHEAYVPAVTANEQAVPEGFNAGAARELLCPSGLPLSMARRERPGRAASTQHERLAPLYSTDLAGPDIGVRAILGQREVLAFNNPRSDISPRFTRSTKPLEHGSSLSVSSRLRYAADPRDPCAMPSDGSSTLEYRNAGTTKQPWGDSAMTMPHRQAADLHSHVLYGLQSGIAYQLRHPRTPGG